MKKLFNRFFSLEILLNWNTSFLVSESSENILDAKNSKVLTWAILGEGEGHFQDSKSLRSSNLEREFWLLWYQIWRNSSIFRRNFNALNFWGGMPTWEPIKELQKMQFFWSQSSFSWCYRLILASCNIPLENNERKAVFSLSSMCVQVWELGEQFRSILMFSNSIRLWGH